MFKNTENTYGFVAKFFHWVVSFGIIALIAVGFLMSSMDPSPDKYELYGMHKASGVIILILIFLRLLWRFLGTRVHPVEGLPFMIKLAASVGHFLLYIFMLSMPISGILMSRFGGHDINVFNLFIIPAFAEKSPEIAGIFYQIHTLGVWAFIAIIAMHIGAAFYHHFIRRDNVLMRMIK